MVACCGRCKFVSLVSVQYDVAVSYSRAGCLRVQCVTLEDMDARMPCLRVLMVMVPILALALGQEVSQAKAQFSCYNDQNAPQVHNSKQTSPLSLCMYVGAPAKNLS